MLVSPSTPNVEDALRDASFVRMHWVGLSGMSHAMILPKARYLDLRAADPPVFPFMCRSFYTPIFGERNFVRPTDKSVLLRPDEASLRIVAHTNGRHVSVMCDTDPKGPEESLAAWKGCPRQLVRKAAQDLESALGVDIKVGFELEWVMIDPETGADCPARPFPRDIIGGGATMSGLRGKLLDVLDEVATALETGGVPVWRFHTEVTDQIELSLAPVPALEAVDNLYHARETIRAIFTRHGLTATLLPKPFLDNTQPLNGCHMHFSLNPRAGSSKVDDETYKSFLAGVLDQMKAIIAIGMPTPDSYSRREFDGCGKWIGWGTANRRMPVRGIAPNRWEVRCLDNTANTYLFLAAVLQAGLAGVRSAMPLRHRDFEGKPAEFDAAKLAEVGITEPTPESAEKALEALSADQPGSSGLLREVLGEWLVDQYVETRKRDAEALQKLSFVKRREVYMKTLE